MAVEARRHRLTAGARVAAAQLVVVEQPIERDRPGRVVIRSQQQTVDPVLDVPARSTHLGRDHRGLERHRLDDAASWEEPFGRSIIEAMALETAVIATKVGGPRGYIEHGVNGLLLRPDDDSAWAIALDRLLDDDELRGRYASAGRQTVATRFDRHDYVSRMLEVYDEVAER